MVGGAQSASLSVSGTMWRVLCVAAAAPVLLVLLLLLLAAAAAGRGAASLPAPGTPATDVGAAAAEADVDADVCCRREQHFVRVGVGEWRVRPGDAQLFLSLGNLAGLARMPRNLVQRCGSIANNNKPVPATKLTR